MISADEIIDALTEAKAAYIVTVNPNNEVNAILLGDKNPEPIAKALDAILTFEDDNPEVPQVISTFLGLYEQDDIILN